MTYLELLTAIRESLASSLSKEWAESHFAPGTPVGRASREDMHLTFSVGLPDSRRLRGNQRGHLAMSTTIEVEWAFTLRNREERESYDDALRAEAEMLRALAGVKDDIGEPALSVERIQRTMVDDWLMVTNAVCLVPHPVTL